MQMESEVVNGGVHKSLWCLVLDCTGTGKSTLLNALEQLKTTWIELAARLGSDFDSFKSSISSREADLQETKATLQSAAATVWEIKDKAEALHDAAEVKQCQAVIKFISGELRYVEAEFYKLYFQAVLWLLLRFIAKEYDSSRSLHVRVLSVLQALEVVLIASGDVEKNPGPTFLDGKLVFVLCIDHTNYLIASNFIGSIYLICQGCEYQYRRYGSDQHLCIALCIPRV